MKYPGENDQGCMWHPDIHAEWELELQNGEASHNEEGLNATNQLNQPVYEGYCETCAKWLKDKMERRRD